jgi:hypothetical protein
MDSHKLKLIKLSVIYLKTWGALKRFSFAFGVVLFLASLVLVLGWSKESSATIFSREWITCFLIGIGSGALIAYGVFCRLSRSAMDPEVLKFHREKILSESFIDAADFDEYVRRLELENFTKSAPERLGKLLSMLVPRTIRERCFQPYFEDLKADRLEKISRNVLACPRSLNQLL